MKTKDDGRLLELPDAPAIQGLRFRHCRGEVDYPQMVTILEAKRDADRLEYTVSIEDIERAFKHLENQDPVLDLLFAEVDGEAVGYAETWWKRDPSGNYLHNLYVNLHPEWRGKGICNAMVRLCEQRLRETAKAQPRNGPHLFQMILWESEKEMMSVLEREGYKVYRYGLIMIRPDMADIPDLALPEGIEVRPVKQEHIPLVFEAWNEACKDMRGQIPISEEDARELQESPLFDPSIWQVAWHGDRVIGTVMNFIDEENNAQYNRKRGHVEMISVQRAWRRKGIAKAMIARSLRVLKEKGMTEAALGVDAENPSGALHLYEKMGFRIERRVIFYRKPMR